MDYYACGYVRISKEDGDKIESNSIVNQKDIILNFIENKENITLVDIKADDGYSGIDFNRPSFKSLMEDINKGKINCVIVKDLSRFGRNYIKLEQYKRWFLGLNVRFISINDGYDSINSSSANDILFSLKSIFNDEYSRNTSEKIRSVLSIKRKKGEYVSPVCPYGYIKDKLNKNKIVPDKYAADIVRNIFNWKIEGLSNQSIARRLNDFGILSPSEYKKFQGMKYSSGFKQNPISLWSSVTVDRILKNEIYIGVLEQGKSTKPNYKIKKMIKKNKSDWDRIENNHIGIIEKEKFNTVNSLLQRNTRVSHGNKGVYLFAGKLFCGDCGKNMIRCKIKSKGIDYIYYICGNYKKDKNSCFSHRIKEEVLKNSILTLLQKGIEEIIEVENILNFTNNFFNSFEDIQKYNAQIEEKEKEVKKYNNLKEGVKKSFLEGIINKNDFENFNNIYTKGCKDCLKSISKIKEELELEISKRNDKYILIDQYKNYKNIINLDRRCIVCFINKIFIYDKNKIQIEFSFCNYYK